MSTTTAGSVSCPISGMRKRTSEKDKLEVEIRNLWIYSWEALPTNKNLKVINECGLE